jgi:hypothetical protein
MNSVDIFLHSMMCELDKPEHLDFSDNYFTDESLFPFIKYVFANEESKLKYFDL